MTPLETYLRQRLAAQKIVVDDPCRGGLSLAGRQYGYARSHAAR